MAAIWLKRKPEIVDQLNRHFSQLNLMSKLSTSKLFAVVIERQYPTSIKMAC